MLSTILVTVFALALIMALMAVGVLLSGRQLAGSCGGNPDSAHCGCSPEKRDECRKKNAPSGDAEADGDVFSGPALTSDTLAPPGERRLIQLRTGRQ